MKYLLSVIFLILAYYSGIRSFITGESYLLFGSKYGFSHFVIVNGANVYVALTNFLGCMSLALYFFTSAHHKFGSKLTSVTNILSIKDQKAKNNLLYLWIFMNICVLNLIFAQFIYPIIFYPIFFK